MHMLKDSRRSIDPQPENKNTDAMTKAIEIREAIDGAYRQKVLDKEKRAGKIESQRGSQG